MKSSFRIRSAHPKIKSPFVNGQQVFPKDFFGEEESVLIQKSDNNAVNSTFEHHSQPLGNKLTESNPKGKIIL